MLLTIKQEHRDILADLEKRGQLRGVVRSVPDNTAPHIVARLTAGLVALCESRSISEVDERTYQLQSYARLRRRAQPSDQTEVLAQIARFKATHRSKRGTVADARALAKKYSPLPLEDVVRGLRLGYSEDTFNSLRLAAITAEVRQGITGADFSGGFAANSPRDAYNGGQAADPSQSLRDDDDDFWKDLFNDDYDPDAYDDDSQRHQRAAEYHRSCARKAPTMALGAEHYAAADKHDRAARQYPDADASKAARAASTSLKLAEAFAS
jgi:hypothetical protein